MVAMTTSPALDLRTIANSNPAYIRRSLGSLDFLKRSLLQRGMVLPILLRPDYLIVDGARRFEAARELGWDTVPVTWANNWATVKAHFERARELAGAEFPQQAMTWKETEDLFVTLRPLYTDVRDKSRKQRRQQADEAKRRGEPKPRYNYLERSLWPIAAAEVIGIRFEDLKIILDIFAAQRRIGELHGPKMLRAAEDASQAIEDEGGSIVRLHNFLRRATNGSITVEEIRRYPDTVRNTRVTIRRSRSTGGSRYPAREPAVADEAFVTNLGQVLEHIGQQASMYGIVSAEMDRQLAAKIVRQLQTAITDIHRLRRLLDAHATSDNPSVGESK